MVAKPHQRLTKYPLLLKSILKKTDEPATRDVLNSMVRVPNILHRSACWVGFCFLDLMESPSAVHQRSHGCTCSIYQTSVSPLHQVAVVEGFINSVDSQMRLRQEQQKLATVSARIDSYEAVEGSSEEVEKVVLVPFGSNQCSVRRSLTSAASSSDP